MYSASKSCPISFKFHRNLSQFLLIISGHIKSPKARTKNAFRYFLFLLFMLNGFLLKAQKIDFNPDVDTVKVEHQKAIQFYKSYLKAVEDGQDVFGFWKANERYSRSKFLIDPMAFAVSRNISVYAMGAKKTILEVSVLNEIVSIKTIFNWLSGDTITTLAIVNHHVDLTSSKPRFIYPEDLNAKILKSDKLRNINFIHAPEIKFNKIKARMLIKSIRKLELDWGLKSRNINYFYSESSYGLNSLRGGDFLLGGNSKSRGMAYPEANTVFCYGQAENYFHEIVHVYLGFLANKDLEEGIAIFYGGAVGSHLSSHVEILKDFLMVKPNFKFTFPNTNQENLASGVSIRNLVYALACHKAYHDHGIVGLRRIMDMANYNEVLKKEFKVDLDKPEVYDKFVKQIVSEF